MQGESLVHSLRKFYAKLMTVLSISSLLLPDTGNYSGFFLEYMFDPQVKS